MYKILVPVDGSEESEKAITQAIHMAELEKGKLIFISLPFSLYGI